MLYSRPEAVLTALLMAAGLLPMDALAQSSFLREAELVHTLHTHLFPSFRRLPSSDEIKTASVCFVTDTRECSGDEFSNSDDMENNGSPDGGGNPDYDLDDAERCKKEGYTLTSCAEGETPEGFCIYNHDYFEKCTCPSGYKICEPPYYGVGQACGNKYASCEKDTERACKELNSNYTNTCESGWQINPNDKCKYDETFGTCCNLCKGYDYTTIPEGYVQDGAACTDCNGQTKYKVKVNPCDGFLDCGSMGPAAGASSCQSGSQIKYDNCKPCPNLGTLTSCPSPYTCTYEECSNRYYKSGCKSGYDWNASSKTCTAQCESSYKYTCTGSGYAGGVGTACGGKYKSCKCSNSYEWNGKSCAVNCNYDETWDGSQCVCNPSYYTYSCTGAAEIGDGEPCNGKYKSCFCGYMWEWNGNSCTYCGDEYKHSCSGEGILGGNGKECAGYYSSCRCKTNYEWTGQGCKFQNACTQGSEIGYILYSDKTRSKNLISGKTPIGIVVCSYAGNSGGQAMALTATKNPSSTIWATEYVDIPNLTNYAVGVDGLNTEQASLEISSCENTKAIIAQGTSDTYPAAWSANHYITEGTNRGDWCLPAAGIISAYYGNYENERDIKEGFSKAKGIVPSDYIWTSSERNYDHALFSYPSAHYAIEANFKGHESVYEIRPVIEF